MIESVSKVRARRTKTREKSAGKRKARRSRFRDKPAVGYLIVFLLWAVTLCVLRIEDLLQGALTPNVWLPLAGDGAFLLVGIFSAGLFLRIVKPRLLESNAQILLLSVIVLLSVVISKGLILASGAFPSLDTRIVGFVLPFALAPLLATILVDAVVGVALGVCTSLIMAILADYSFTIFLTGALASLVTAQISRQVRTRARVFRVGLVIGLTEVTCVFGATALDWSSSDAMLVLYQAAACLASGFLSAVLVLLILPLFETLFQITTDITLLELSDLGHPLLQRLALQAPGTYHHSLVVANLAQAAADEVGANSLLARVCAYFHDIGKLTKPEFFAENISRRRNPHDDLPPSMSTLVITSHVKEGISLAMHYKLPPPVKAVIQQHHGTSLLSFFHHKARNQQTDNEGTEMAVPVETGAAVEEADFRYQGPKPSTREIGIICMADAVEAASRSIEKATPGHIEGLVDDVVNIKLKDGQLAECELTLSDLTRVKRSFVFTLTNMLHARVPYPKDENRSKQPAKRAQDTADGGREPGPLPVGKDDGG